MSEQPIENYPALHEPEEFDETMIGDPVDDDIDLSDIDFEQIGD